MGSWCLMYGVWCMVYGAWCMVYGVWCMVYGVWCMVYVVWCMVHGVWCMVYGEGSSLKAPARKRKPASFPCGPRGTCRVCGLRFGTWGVYITQIVLEVILQKSNAPQIRQLFLYCYLYKKEVDRFV